MASKKQLVRNLKIITSLAENMIIRNNARGMYHTVKMLSVGKVRIDKVVVSYPSGNNTVKYRLVFNPSDLIPLDSGMLALVLGPEELYMLVKVALDFLGIKTSIDMNKPMYVSTIEDLFKYYDKITVNEVVEHGFAPSTSSARVLLHRLVKKGLLKRCGKIGRYTAYCLNKGD